MSWIRDIFEWASPQSRVTLSADSVFIVSLVQSLDKMFFAGGLRNRPILRYNKNLISETTTRPEVKEGFIELRNGSRGHGK